MIVCKCDGSVSCYGLVLSNRSAMGRRRATRCGSATGRKTVQALKKLFVLEGC